MLYRAAAKETGCGMIDDANPDPPDLARFLQDWTALWREELLAQATDPNAVTEATDIWRTLAVLWTLPARAPSLPDCIHDGRTVGRHANATWPETAAPAPDPRDATIDRLTRRIDELEARVAELDVPKPRASPIRTRDRG